MVTQRKERKEYLIGASAATALQKYTVPRWHGCDVAAAAAAHMAVAVARTVASIAAATVKAVAAVAHQISTVELRVA